MWYSLSGGSSAGNTGQTPTGYRTGPTETGYDPASGQPPAADAPNEDWTRWWESPEYIDYQNRNMWG